MVSGYRLITDIFYCLAVETIFRVCYVAHLQRAVSGGASLGLRHGRNPRLVCGTLSAYCLAGSKLCFQGVFVSGNIMSKALLSIGDWLPLAP